MITSIDGEKACDKIQHFLEKKQSTENKKELLQQNKGYVEKPTASNLKKEK